MWYYIVIPFHRRKEQRQNASVNLRRNPQRSYCSHSHTPFPCRGVANDLQGFPFMEIKLESAIWFGENTTRRDWERKESSIDPILLGEKETASS